MYDKDNSGEIDLDEMVEIFCLMYSIQVSYWSTLHFFILININSIDILAVLKGYTEEEAIERAGKVFESLDKNNDGGLAEDEFVKVLRWKQWKVQLLTIMARKRLI